MERGLPSVVRKRRISLNRGAFLSISKVLYDASSDWINLDVYSIREDIVFCENFGIYLETSVILVVYKFEIRFYWLWIAQ